IYEADRMNSQTANAFLKTLEEPPRGTTLLLLTERPYALLPTIRSRCMNVRLPDVGVVKADEGWQGWLEDYRGWLERLTGSRLGREGAARLVLEVYGLVHRFEEISARLTEEAWQEVKEQQPEHLTDEAREANEAGFKKSQRARLLADLEQATLAFARAGGDNTNRRAPRAIGTLEQAYTLMERLNYQQPAALEWFFLQSLQIWTR
ncbi:MAG: DNA polymerase III subunit gamma/tau, partial [Opitutales bacterium]